MKSDRTYSTALIAAEQPVDWGDFCGLIAQWIIDDMTKNIKGDIANG